MTKKNKIKLFENADLEQAEIILASKSFLDKTQKMTKDLNNLQGDLLSLYNEMKGVFGPDKTASFSTNINSVMKDGVEVLTSIQDTINSEILKLEGKIEDSVNNDMMNYEDDVSSDGVDDTMDNVDDEVELSPSNIRMKKESLENQTKKMSLVESGKRLLMKESLNKLVGWVLTEAYERMPEKEFNTFKDNIEAKRRENPEALAGWIGKMKYGSTLDAQLSNPLKNTTSSDKIELSSGE